MAAVALKHFTPRTDGVVPPARESSLFRRLQASSRSGREPLDHRFLSRSISIERTHGKRCEPVRAADVRRPMKSESSSYDIVIIGAGIIGLSIARQFLIGSDLSVAVVDAAVPCSGATGAGQGYIWRIHKTPGSDKWELAMRSHELWEDLASSIQDDGKNPAEVLGWKKTGSLLVGQTVEESANLQRRVKLLSDAGLTVAFLSGNDLLSEEPSLMLGEEGGAAFIPDDCQLDARRTVAFIEEANRNFAANGRYAEFYHEPATCLLRSKRTGEVEAIQTTKSTLYSKKAAIVAAGCWSGSLMDELIKQSDIELDLPIKPRKGHLLVVDNFKSFELNHGVMEAGYVNHKAPQVQYAVAGSGPGPLYDAQTTSISMTATMDTAGRLVLGSSRQLVGFDTDVDESIISRIWERAREFFPMLRNISLSDFSSSREVRVGLRPYMPEGKPVIGPVPGLSNMFLCAGHEGEGLSLALGTAEMIVDMILGHSTKVDPLPFAVEGRRR